MKNAQTRETGPPPTRTVQRGFAVLETLAENSGDGGLGTTDISSLVGLDKATTNRLLNTLCGLGYAYQDPESRLYKLTGKLLAISEKFQANMDIPRRIAPFLTKLRDETKETVHFGVREMNRVVYISKLEATSPVQLASAIGQSMPMHTTALGKALLASMSDVELERVLSHLQLDPRTDRSITDLGSLRQEIRETKIRGYSVDEEENQPGATCVGSGLVNDAGLAVGAISVSGPTFRVAGKLGRIGKLCQGTALTIRPLL